MTQTHVAFITVTDTKHIERANGQSFDLYQVHDHLNNVWVVKKPVWDLAQSLVGQQATFITRQEQKGSFLNFYADQIIPLQSQGGVQYAHPMDQPQGVTQAQAQAMNQGWNPYENPQQPQPQMVAPVYTPQQMPLQAPVSPQDGQQAPETAYGSAQHDLEQREREAAKELSINRSVAVKAAAKVCSGDQYVFWTLLPDVMAFLQNGLLPAKIVEAMFAPLGGERVPNASAEGETPSAPDDDSDIPF